VQPLAGEGSGACALVSGSQEPPKRTLFQDIFGDSALTSAPVPPMVQQNVVGNPKHWNNREIASVFDGPAYLIPTLETLFDAVMSHFLTLRPSEDGDDPAPDLPGDGNDSVMDIDEPPDGPLVGVPRPERVVDVQEMDAFIGLFRQHGVKPSSSTHLPQLPNGGAPKIHSNAHKTMNGHSHTPKLNPKINNDVPPPSTGVTIIGYSSLESSPRTVVSSSPALTGKKRKTSS